MTKSARLEVRVDPDLLAELQEFAASRPGTVAEHVRYAVRLYLDVQSEGREKTMGSEYYTVSDETVETVTAILNLEVDSEVTEETVKAEICGDWHEGQEHQDWIDSTEPQEIADWLASFYS